MEKVIIRDVEEPEKTEIHTKIENTKEGLKKLARFFSLLVSDYNTNNIYCDEHNKIMSVEINSERFWLPLDISYDEENIIVSGIRAISSIPVAKLQKQCLLNYMETIYRFSKNDYGQTLAILVYKNMSEERKRAKNGRTLKQYLTVTSQTILLWNMTTDNIPALLDFWELGLSSAKDLKLLYDNRFAKLSIPMQACIMQLLNDSTCRDTDSEYSL